MANDDGGSSNTDINNTMTGGDIGEMFLASKACGTGEDPLQWHSAWDTLSQKTFDEGKERLDSNPVGAGNFNHTSMRKKS